MDNGQGTTTGTVLLALLGGAALGAGVALLYAPQSGRRTRQRIREFGEDASDSARELFSKAEECLEEVKSRTAACMHKGHGCDIEKRQLAEEAALAGR